MSVYSFRGSLFFLILILMGGCLPVLVHQNDDDAEVTPVTGNIEGLVVLPANSKTGVLGHIRPDITMTQLTAALIQGRTTITTAPVSGIGEFVFTNVNLYENYRITIRGGKVELSTILTSFPRSGFRVSIDSLTTARVLLYDRLQIAGTTIDFSRLESSDLSQTVTGINTAILDGYTNPDIAQFNEGKSSILNLDNVQTALSSATGNAVLILAGQTTTSTTSSTTTSSSTSTTTTTSSTTTSTALSTRPTIALTTPASPEFANILLSYTISDDDSSLASVTLAYSIDSGTSFASATTEGLTLNISTSPGGETRTIVWKSAKDLPDKNEDVVLKITSYDAEGSGGSSESSSFRLNNNFTDLYISDRKGRLIWIDENYVVTTYASSTYSDLSSLRDIELNSSNELIVNNSYTGSTIASQSILKLSDFMASPDSLTIATLTSNFMATDTLEGLTILSGTATSGYLVGEVASAALVASITYFSDTTPMASLTIVASEAYDIETRLDGSVIISSKQGIYGISGIQSGTLFLNLAPNSSGADVINAAHGLALFNSRLYITDTHLKTVFVTKGTAPPVRINIAPGKFDSPQDLILNNSGHPIVVDPEKVLLIAKPVLALNVGSPLAYITTAFTDSDSLFSDYSLRGIAIKRQ